MCTAWKGTLGADVELGSGKLARRARVCVGVTRGDAAAPVLAPATEDAVELVWTALLRGPPPITVGS